MRSLILSALILASAFQTALGEYDSPWWYTVSNNQATISGYNGYGGDVRIPDNIGGYPVVGFAAKVFFGKSYIGAVTIPATVRKIPAAAFSSCTGLQRITFLGDAVDEIGDAAFARCFRLESIIVPSDVGYIGSAAFQNCIRLNNVSFNGNKLTTIGRAAFQNCEKLSSIFIPESVTDIGDFTFKGCKWLSEVFFAGDVPLDHSGEYERFYEYTVFENVPAVKVYYWDGTSGWGDEFRWRPTVKLTKKLSPNISPPEVWYYYDEGEALAAHPLRNGYATVPGCIARVRGEFSWENPDLIPPVGLSSQSIIFTPHDTFHFEIVKSTVSIDVEPGPLRITSDISPVSLGLHSGYTYNITTNYNPNYILFMSSGLPLGLKINKITGLISGKVRKPGVYNVELKAVFDNFSTATDIKQLTILQSPGFLLANKYNAKRGKIFQIRPKYAGYPAPTFSIVSGSLPPGLSLNASTAAITGTPTTIGTYPFTVRGSNSAGNTDRSATIVVK